MNISYKEGSSRNQLKKFQKDNKVSEKQNSLINDPILNKMMNSKDDDESDSESQEESFQSEKEDSIKHEEKGRLNKSVEARKKKR